MSVPARVRGRPYGVSVPGAALRREFHIRGLTAAAVARRAKVAQSTVSQALNDHRVHPRKLLAIVGVLKEVEPIPELVKLLDAEQPVGRMEVEPGATTKQEESTRG